MNDWEYAFALIIKELEYRITNSANEEEKKRLRSEKIKYVNKLIKCTPVIIIKNKSLIEI